MTAAGEAFDAWPILAVLERHGVEFVMVGGYAARMHGAQRPTRDVDVTPRTTRENLDRLAAALEELDARIRSEADPAGFPFAVTGESLVGVRMLNLQTRHGELDLTVRPAAFEGGYDDLLDRSRVHSLGGVHVRVAALEDVIRSKETAAREKDFRALPELYRLAGSTAHRAAAIPEPPSAGVTRPGDEVLNPAERIAAARRLAARRRERDRQTEP